MIVLLLIIFGLVFGASALILYATLPSAYDKYEEKQKRKTAVTKRALEEMFVWVAHRRLFLVLGLSPVVLGIAFFFLFGHKLLIAVGIIIGLLLPSAAIHHMQKQRRKKFQAQLIDALISLSQSLKAGLSLIQALEVLVEEMPPPISQEFSLVVKENKMGVLLEESFERLNKKMDLEDLNLIATAILIARETGGNLTNVFINLSENIRQKNKIADQVKTLTTQARWQAIIMSFLPIVFAAVVFNMNKHLFDIMWQSDKGRLLLIWCVFSEIIGVMLLRHFSRVEV